MLVGLKFMVGAFLLAALFSAAYEKIHFGSSDDAMLDVALLTSALATVASALPGLLHGGELLLLGDRRIDAVRDRERARDLRPRLPGEAGTAAAGADRAGGHQRAVRRNSERLRAYCAAGRRITIHRAALRAR